VQAENLILRLASLNHRKVVGKVTGHGFEKWRFFHSKQWQRFFLSLSNFPGQLLKPTSLLFGVYRDYCFGLNRPEREADLSRTCRSELLE